MASASIVFTDAGGTVTITMADHGLATARFNGWYVDPQFAGETAENPGGRMYAFRMGMRRRVKFEMPRIVEQDELKVHRLKEHVDNAGFFKIITGDIASREYDECQTVKGTTVGIRRNPENRDMTLIIHATHQAASPQPMLCIYAA